MSESSTTPASPVDIETRQDDLLRQLDALEKRIDRVLADYAATGQSPARGVKGDFAAEISEPSMAAEMPGVALPFSAATVMG